MRVILNGNESAQVCDCATMLAHWESASHHKATHCAVAHCNCPSTDAVFVTVADEAGPRRYVVPACHWHAQQTGFDTDLTDEFQLVPSGLQTTCPQGVKATAAV